MKGNILIQNEVDCGSLYPSVFEVIRNHYIYIYELALGYIYK